MEKKMECLDRTGNVDDHFINLREIVECVPGSFYWKDKDSRYLGFNRTAMDMLGFKKLEDFFEKTDYDLWPDQAEELRRNDEKVMESGVPVRFEEFVQIEGKTYCYAVIKVPMKNEAGEIIGVIGNSLDITDQKEVGRLKAKSEEQEKFKKVADDAVHDIRTPLQVLSSILKYQIKNLPENEHIMLRDSVNCIRRIAQVLLEFSSGRNESSKLQYMIVSLALTEVVEQKKHQYNGKDIEFQYSFDPSDQFEFIYGNSTNFERMMSNIINNSVEAFDGKKGVVKICFFVDENEVKIVVEDSGKGMPQKMVEKLMKNEPVSTTKEGGFGIGTGQIRDALKELNGIQIIESTLNVGTKITLAIPKANKPKWATDRISLQKGDVIVVLDDDVLIHRLLEARLKKYIPYISLNFFEDGQKAIDFINSHEKRGDILLLSDYELRNQELNGLDVIEKCNIRNFRSILISSIYNSSKIQDIADSLNIRILHKTFIGNVPIVLDGKVENSMSFDDADVVVLDDDGTFANLLSDFLRSNGFVVDTYYDPQDFMENLSKYRTNTKIVSDNYFEGDIRGNIFIKQLFERGFKDFCVLTGFVDIDVMLQYPKDTKFVLKGEDDNEEHILRWCKRSS